MELRTQRAVAAALVFALIAALATITSERGGVTRSAMLLDRVSATREARIRQLVLEREKGDADIGAKEFGDGEDEQQGGIENVHWGSGWGPEMDQALGNKVIDEHAMDAAPAATRPVVSEHEKKELASSKSIIANFERTVQDAEKHLFHINSEADAAEQAATEVDPSYNVNTPPSRRAGSARSVTRKSSKASKQTTATSKAAKARKAKTVKRKGSSVKTAKKGKRR